MNGELLALGVSHKTAPLELRERLALTEGRAAAVLADLTARDEIHEAVAISTCNRTELYLVASDTVAAESAALSVLARQAETSPTELADSLYALRDLDVAQHLFAVAAGLDSMIVGEAEIQGQVKRAYELALVEGMTGPISNRLFRAALAAGKHVRTETGVGRSRVSVASVAAELATHGLDTTGAGATRPGARCPAAPENAGTSGEPAHFDAASLARAAVASVDAAAHADGASASGTGAQDDPRRPAADGSDATARQATERSDASGSGATEGPAEEDGASASIGDDQERPSGDLSDRRVLVIGAGEQGERTAQALNDRGAHAVFVANRHYDRALGLAQRFSGSAVPLDELPGELVQADIVVSCTSSPHQLVGREELELVLSEREGRPLVIIDIAVPRDIDPGVRTLANVTLYDMDDLQGEVARNLSVREAEAERARELVDGDVQRFRAWLAGLDVLPTIRGLRERADAIVEQVLAENAPRWESLSAADDDRLRAMARSLVARLFHEPTMRLKAGAEDEAAYVHVAALRELFALDAAAPEPDLDDDEDEHPTAEITELDSRRRG